MFVCMSLCLPVSLYVHLSGCISLPVCLSVCARVINNPTYGWKALRLLARKSPYFFGPIPSGSTQQYKKVPQYLELIVGKMAKDLPVCLSHSCHFSIECHLDLKALHTGHPPYLSDLLQRHEPTRSLRSSSSHQLSVPHHSVTFGSRAFWFSAPRVWNSLPVSICESQSLPTFRCHLKTIYFRSTYRLSAAHLA